MTRTLGPTTLSHRVRSTVANGTHGLALVSTQRRGRAEYRSASQGRPSPGQVLTGERTRNYPQSRPLRLGGPRRGVRDGTKVQVSG